METRVENPGCRPYRGFEACISASFPRLARRGLQDAATAVASDEADYLK